MNLNIGGTLNAIRAVYAPYYIIPHLTISTFDELPIPLGPSLAQRLSLSKARSDSSSIRKVDIKGIVLDKDNCFAADNTNKLWPEYQKTWDRLRAEYPDGRLLVVSNSAGSYQKDPDNKHGQNLSENLNGVPVLRHFKQKPSVGDEILEYFAKATNGEIQRADQIAIVGDRLFTDVMMANMMGSWAVWVSRGVKLSDAFLPRFERSLIQTLTHAGFQPRFPIQA